MEWNSPEVAIPRLWIKSLIDVIIQLDVEHIVV